MVVVDQTDNGLKVAVRGEIDFRACERLVRQVTAQVIPGGDATILRLDLGGVTYCDSAGIAALMEVRHACTSAGWTLVLDEVGPFVERVLDMTGLSAWFGLARP
jgi:anti-anti-sigma factor